MDVNSEIEEKRREEKKGFKKIELGLTPGLPKGTVVASPEARLSRQRGLGPPPKTQFRGPPSTSSCCTRLGGKCPKIMVIS